jgi:hypothetical protein
MRPWLVRRIGSSGVFIGVLDTRTDRVQRGPSVVSYEKIKEAVGDPWGPETESEWAEWFASNAENRSKIEDDARKWKFEAGLKACSDRALDRRGFDWDRKVATGQSQTLATVAVF